DAVAFDEREKVLRAIAAERRFGEMRIGRQEAIGRAVEIGEVAAAAARNQDLLSRTLGMVEQQDAAAALARGQRGHHAGCACAEDYRVETMHVAGWAAARAA